MEPAAFSRSGIAACRYELDAVDRMVTAERIGPAGRMFERYCYRD